MWDYASSMQSLEGGRDGGGSAVWDGSMLGKAILSLFKHQAIENSNRENIRLQYTTEKTKM